MSIAGLYGRQAQALTTATVAGGGFAIVAKGSASVKAGTDLVCTVSATDKAMLYIMTANDRRWSLTVPLEELTETATTYSIATGSNYIDFKLSKSGSTVTMTRSSTTGHMFYAYALNGSGSGGGGGGSSETHTHPNLSTLNGITAEKVTSWDTAASHPSDTTKHITADERTSWSAAASHTSDTTVHITADERSAWNAAVNELAGLNTAIGSGTV